LRTGDRFDTGVQTRARFDLRAFDSETGKELWSAELPAGGQATPMTFADAAGKQFIVIAAGGHARLGTKLGDYVVAFALP
jgi:quinoprotein glucose dehydrogenase